MNALNREHCSVCSCSRAYYTFNLCKPASINNTYTQTALVRMSVFSPLNFQLQIKHWIWTKRRHREKCCETARQTSKIPQYFRFPFKMQRKHLTNAPCNHFPFARSIDGAVYIESTILLCLRWLFGAHIKSVSTWKSPDIYILNFKIIMLSISENAKLETFIWKW